MEIKVDTRFEELDRVFMIKEEYDGNYYKVFMPVEIKKIDAVEHEVNDYQADIYKIKYSVKALGNLEEFSIYEESLYTVEDLAKVLHEWSK